MNENKTGKNRTWPRREFIQTGLQAAGGAILLATPVSSIATGYFSPAKDYTVQEIINIILKEISHPLNTDTVDTIKTGSADQKVTGVVTTMFPTIAVIKEAIKLNANFIIAHEPSFYNHRDDKNMVENNEVLRLKLQLLNEHNITIWRSHDSWHDTMPDGITFGVVKKTGWKNYYKTGEKILNIPPITLNDLAEHLKTTLQIAHVKVLGDLSQTCKKIALLPGAWGGKEQISVMVNDKPDVMIAGEVNEWETPEYTRDARLLGMNVSLIILGHSVSEEPGMEWMAEWLQPKLPGITVTHVSSGDPFVVI